jgi:hypothetical protein
MADTTLSPMEQDGMLQELGRILPSAVLDLTFRTSRT